MNAAHSLQLNPQEPVGFPSLVATEAGVVLVLRRGGWTTTGMSHVLIDPKAPWASALGSMWPAVNFDGAGVVGPGASGHHSFLFTESTISTVDDAPAKSWSVLHAPDATVGGSPPAATPVFGGEASPLFTTHTSAGPAVYAYAKVSSSEYSASLVVGSTVFDDFACGKYSLQGQAVVTGPDSVLVAQRSAAPFGQCTSASTGAADRVQFSTITGDGPPVFASELSADFLTFAGNEHGGYALQKGAGLAGPAVVPVSPAGVLGTAFNAGFVDVIGVAGPDLVVWSQSAPTKLTRFSPSGQKLQELQLTSAELGGTPNERTQLLGVGHQIYWAWDNGGGPGGLAGNTVYVARLDCAP